jgi:CO/xanthine dehydrogenase FAD-binding subunit
MIPFHFDYYQPVSVDEAVELFDKLDAQGKKPLYYAGGTEIITLGRLNQVYTEAVIDLKQVPDCRWMGFRDGKLVLGSALSLSEIYDARMFPLLGETGAGVADRTSRNKITLGGNVCGRFIYKEAVLPLLLTDSVLRIAGPMGDREVPITQLFDRTLQLRRGELFVQSCTEASYLRMPYVTMKKRKVSAIDYPLVTLAAIRTNSGIRFAFSGLCAFPFRSMAVEWILNKRDLPMEDRIQQAIAQLPAPILSDIKGSAVYREFVLKNMLKDALTTLGGAGG